MYDKSREDQQIRGAKKAGGKPKFEAIQEAFSFAGQHRDERPVALPAGVSPKGLDEGKAGMTEIRPSVIYRTGKLTASDYAEAIQALMDAATQLEPDGRPCAVCTSIDHQAWECMHNPLVVARQLQIWDYVRTCNVPWRCFHCNEVFYTRESALQHFGRTEQEKPKCQHKVENGITGCYDA